MKLVKYPPPQEHINLQGSGPHKDGSFLTYLLQGTPHRGLEVQNKAGDWISVPPIPGTLVVNIGRSLESITRGVCVATTHRVRLDSDYFRASDGSSLGPRYSFPAFQSLSLELTQENMLLDLPAHIAALAKDRELNSDVEEAFKDVYNGSIGEGTFMARLTSHPDVAQRWYPAETIRALRRQKGIRDKGHNHTRGE
jgi:isopenicillin N synthase-like dioxygenase